MRRRHAWSPMVPVLCLALGLSAACESRSPPTQADPAFNDLDVQAVVQAHRNWVDAYQAGDVDRLVGLLDDQPDLLIFHPRERNRYDGVLELRPALERMFASVGPVTWTDFHSAVTVQGNVGWLTTEVLLESRAFEEPLAVRGTEIWVRTEDGWKLTHGHWSPTPPEP